MENAKYVHRVDFFALIHSGYDPTGKNILLSDFFAYLPQDIDKNDKKAVAQYLVNQIVSLQGYTFGFHSVKKLEASPRGWPKYMARSDVFVFHCTQRVRCWPQNSDMPIHRRRNYKKMERIACLGVLNVYFCDPYLVPFHGDDNVDIAIRYTHTTHTSRELYGVPLVVRQWIKENHGKTPYETWERLMSAIERGNNFRDLDKKYFSLRHVSYWHRKAQVERVGHISTDPWINLEALLKEDPLVIPYMGHVDI
jgi:hypothetical protein